MMHQLKKIILTNFRYKVVALTLACATWYFVQGEEVLDRNVDMIVNIRLPKGLVNRDGSSFTQKVTIRGPRAAMGRGEFKYIRAEVNLTDAGTTSTGPMDYPLSSANIIGDWDRRLSIRFSQPVLKLEIDEKFARMIEIKEVLQGSPAPGFIVEKATVSPAYVRVSGVRSVISKIDRLNTETRDISGIDQSKVLEARIILPVGVELENSSSDVAQIKLQVGESKVNKKFGAIPVEVTGTGLRWLAKPAAVDIEIQGSAAVIDSVKVTDLSAFIEAAELTPGTYTKKIQVKIPNDTWLIETKPDNVVITLRPAAARPPANAASSKP